MISIEETTFDMAELPEVVYKYRNWNNLEYKRILTHNEIFFAHPLDCQEQHECNLQYDYDSLTERMIYDYGYMIAPQFGCFADNERRKFANHLVKNSPIYCKGFQIRHEENLRRDLDSYISIFCVSEHRDNYNLWSTFAKGQTGFCIGINTRKMYSKANNFGGSGKVQYFPLDEMPKIRPFYFSHAEILEDFTKTVFSLPDIYKEEDEYRLIKLDSGERRINIREECFEEIILGELISKANKEEIVKISKGRFPHSKLFQAKYDYEFEYYIFNEIK